MTSLTGGVMKIFLEYVEKVCKLYENVSVRISEEFALSTLITSPEV